MEIENRNLSKSNPLTRFCMNVEKYLTRSCVSTLKPRNEETEGESNYYHYCFYYYIYY